MTQKRTRQRGVIGVQYYCARGFFLKQREKSNVYCTTFTIIIFFKVMIHYHLNIQLFTTLFMWQGGLPP
jgi:hypothetical protein